MSNSDIVSALAELTAAVARIDARGEKLEEALQEIASRPAAPAASSFPRSVEDERIAVRRPPAY